MQMIIIQLGPNAKQPMSLYKGQQNANDNHPARSQCKRVSVIVQRTAEMPIIIIQLGPNAKEPMLLYKCLQKCQRELCPYHSIQWPVVAFTTQR